MKQKFTVLGLMLLFVVASCDRRQEQVAPSSDETIERENDYKQDMFNHESAPSNIPGASEKDAMGTEDALVD